MSGTWVSKFGIGNAKCNACGSMRVIQTSRTFKDGSHHVAENCEKCGLFIRWAPQGEESFRDRMFELMAKFANAVTINEVNECQRMARELMREIENGKK